MYWLTAAKMIVLGFAIIFSLEYIRGGLVWKVYKRYWSHAAGLLWATFAALMGWI